MKRLIVLAMAVGFLFGGCAVVGRPTQYSSWEKERTLREERARDYQECSKITLPVYTKEEVTPEEIQMDLDFCTESDAVRRRHVKTAAGAIMLGTLLIPYVNFIGLAAGGAIYSQSPGFEYGNRCMESKGYEKVESESLEADCMRNKGYEWKIRN